MLSLIQGDCLDILPRLADASVDLILADLPYGVTSCAWDAVIPFGPMWSEFNRIAKPNAAMIFTATQPFTSALVMSNPKGFLHSWSWVKRRVTGFVWAKRQPLRCLEDVLVFGRERGSYTYNPQGLIPCGKTIANSGSAGGVGIVRQRRWEAQDARIDLRSRLHELPTPDAGVRA